MSQTPDRALDAMRQQLIRSVNPDGGWGYYPGTSSRLEATCWAILALFAESSADGREALLQSTFLNRNRRGDGLVLDAAEASDERPNLAFNALAAIALNQTAPAPPAVSRLRDALVEHKGIALPQSDINRQDNHLQGWAWIDGEFSWVEPTCWSMAALKKIAPDSAPARARVLEAERLLGDRCCEQGGWNYGNANMLGQQLRPYVSTTALALIALQDRPSEHHVVRSLEYLSGNRVVERSAMALSLTSIALRLFGRPTEDVDACLVEQWDRTGFLGNCHLTAMAYYSLTAANHRAEAFRV